MEKYFRCLKICNGMVNWVPKENYRLIEKITSFQNCRVPIMLSIQKQQFIENKYKTVISNIMKAFIKN